MTELLNQQTPFQDEQLEEAIVGACIIDGDSFNLVAGTLAPESFWSPMLRLYWLAIVAIRNRGEEPGVQSVRMEVGTKATPDTAQHIASIIDVAEPIHSIEQAATRLTLLAKSRTVYYRLIAQTQSAHSADFGEWLTATESILNGLDTTAGRKMESMYEIGLRLMREATTPVSEAVTLSGFAPFDRATGGLVNGMTIVAGRPSMGKSALTHQVMLAVAKKRAGRVLYFSVETGNTETAKRIAVGEADVDYGAAFRNRLDMTSHGAFVSALEMLVTLPLHMLDIASLTPSRIRAEAMRAQQSSDGLALVVVDYIQSVKPDRIGRDVRGDVSSVALALRDLARDLQVPVIAVAQLNRDSELKKRRPCMSDLGESGALEQAASAVVFPFRPSKFGMTDDNNVPFADDYAEIMVGKNRNGTDGCVQLRWNGSRVRFE